MHAYLSKVVSQAASAKLTPAGVRTIESFPSEHLSATLSLFERYDEDGDGGVHNNVYSILSSLSHIYIHTHTHIIYIYDADTHAVCDEPHTQYIYVHMS